MDTLILDNNAIQSRLKRMAYQVYERNFEEKQLILMGVGERGEYLAQRIQQHLQHISTVDAQVFRVEMDRSNETGSMEIHTDLTAVMVKDQPVLIVDDVLYSGRTLLSVVAKVLTAAPKTIQIMVLIDRGHRQMPISADFVGEELATSLQQHVSFILEENQTCKAFLS